MRQTQCGLRPDVRNGYADWEANLSVSDLVANLVPKTRAGLAPFFDGPHPGGCGAWASRRTRFSSETMKARAESSAPNLGGPDYTECIPL